MASAHPLQSVTLPALSSAWVRLLIDKTQDLTLFIDQNSIVIDAVHSDSFSAADVSHWIGHPVRSIVGPESVGKIDVLMSNDASETSSAVPWRHINLVGAAGLFIPVLARYLVLRSDGQEAQMLVLRDLRPLQAANDRFLAAQREMEYQYNEKLRKLESPARDLNGQGTTDAPVENVLSQIERSPFDKVIAETASALEKRCLMAILQEAGGSHDVAAKVAKMPLDAWMEKIKSHNLS
jgi:hypothetical protein